MTTQTTLSRDALNDFVDIGDVLINLTNIAVASFVPAVSVNADGTARIIRGPAFPLSNLNSIAIRSLVGTETARFVVLADGPNATTKKIVDELVNAELPHVVCVLEESCDADAFMDAEDSEAVAERLRQLGYI